MLALRRFGRLGRDELTGLVTRRRGLWNARWHRSRWQAVAFCDVDGLKHVNDTRGYGAGDALLTIVASEIAVCFRDGDVLWRHGGDEFVLFTGCPREYTYWRLLMIRNRMRRDSQGFLIPVSFSFGVVGHYADVSITELIAAASNAMRAARRNKESKHENRKENLT